MVHLTIALIFIAILMVNGIFAIIVTFYPCTDKSVVQLREDNLDYFRLW